MSDPQTLAGAGRMFGGALGGRSQIISPIDAVSRRKPPARPCEDDIRWDQQNQSGTSTSMTITGWGSGAGQFPGPDGRLILAWLQIATTTTPTAPAGWTLDSSIVNGGASQHLFWKYAAGDTSVTFTYASCASATLALLSIPVHRVGSILGGGTYSAPVPISGPSNPNTIVYSAATDTTLDVLNVWTDNPDVHGVGFEFNGNPYATEGWTFQLQVGPTFQDVQSVFTRPSVPRTDQIVHATTFGTPAQIRGEWIVSPRWRPC